MIKKLITSFCAISSVSAINTQAAVVVTGASANTEATFVASNSDLGTSATIARTSGGVFTSINSGNANQLRNGQSGSNRGLYHSAGTNGNHFPATYVMTLDTSVNTLGYDITGINTIAGWNMNGRTLANQQILFEYSLVGSSAWVAIDDYTNPGTGPSSVNGVITYTPFSATDGTGASGSQISITDTAGVIASGVDAIRFTVQNHGVHTGNAQGTVFKEFDVFGTATAPIPEPSSTALLGLAGLGLILRRKRA